MPLFVAPSSAPSPQKPAHKAELRTVAPLLVSFSWAVNMEVMCRAL